MVVPLLRRMINLEELSLFLSVAQSDSDYIDGIQLRNDILRYMPRMNNFQFSIDTAIIKNRSDLVLSSNVDIQRSFIEGQVETAGSHVDVFGKKDGSRTHMYSMPYEFYSRCHIYSNPYNFSEFTFLSNSFQNGTFERVRSLIMTDIRPFEPEFFRIISQSFALLRCLYISNGLPQECTQQARKVITFPQLRSLDLSRAHVDYAMQFLFAEHCQLPRLKELKISWTSLMMVTQNCTNAATRFTCSQLKSLEVSEPFVRSACFHQYFSSL
jgi:hypothetical protein